MQQRQLPFRPVLPHRPLRSISTDCSYVLAGDGFAVLLQHNIFTFLYSVDGPNPDLHALGCTAPAIRLITGTWTKVDTPSVSSQHD